MSRDYSDKTLNINISQLGKTVRLVEAESQCISNRLSDVRRIIGELSRCIGNKECEKLLAVDIDNLREISRRSSEIYMLLNYSLSSFSRSDLKCKEIIKELTK